MRALYARWVARPLQPRLGLLLSALVFDTELDVGVALEENRLEIEHAVKGGERGRGGREGACRSRLLRTWTLSIVRRRTFSGSIPKMYEQSCRGEENRGLYVHIW